MDKLKEIEGRYFKECNVVMLPTKEEPRIRDLCTSVRYKDKPLIFGDFENSYPEECKKQHLYITSDDEIEEGDWFYNERYGVGKYVDLPDVDNSTRRCYQFDEITTPNPLLIPNGVKKIIATTDNSLKGIAQPSQSFIKKYCEKGGIDKVLVEYELGNYDDWFNNGGSPIYKLKTNCLNTITIKPVVTTWTNKQVEDMLFDIHTSLCWEDKTPEESIDNCKSLIAIYQKSLD